MGEPHVSSGLAEVVCAALSQAYCDAGGSLPGSERTKGPQDLVTDVDTGIEHALAARLVDLVPGSGLRSEEGSASPAGGRFEWVLDPVDGTVNFARAIGLHTTACALLDHGVPVLAAVAEHAGGDQFFAVRGAGTHRARPGGPWERIAVSERPWASTLSSVMLTPKLSAPARAASQALVEFLLDETLGFRVLVSQAYEAVSLASGGLDLVIAFQSSGGWTRDAARLLCEEAGGASATLEGPTRGFVLAASTESLHTLATHTAPLGYRIGMFSPDGC